MAAPLAGQAATENAPLFAEWIYPELRFFENRKEARKALRAVAPPFAKAPFSWRRVMVTVGFFFAFGVVIAIIRLVFRGTILDWPLIGGALSGGLGAYLQNRWQRPLIRRALRDRLREIGIPLCETCGYDLRWLPQNRCPECGTAFDPTTGLPVPATPDHARH